MIEMRSISDGNQSELPVLTGEKTNLGEMA